MSDKFLELIAQYIFFVFVSFLVFYGDLLDFG